MIQSVQGRGRKLAVRPSERLRGSFLALSRRIAAWPRPVSAIERGSLVLGVAGVQPRSGSSTVAFNLATRLTEICQGNVLFVESDSTRSSLARRIAGPAHGLREVLKAKQPLASCIHETSVGRLYYLAPGRGKPDETPGPCSAEWNHLMAELADDFEFVVFDLPLASNSTSCYSLASCLDGVLIVSDAHEVIEDLIRAATRRFAEAGTSVIGLVLNKA